VGKVVRIVGAEQCRCELVVDEANVLLKCVLRCELVEGHEGVHQVSYSGSEAQEVLR
jgi:hypothetical protein